MKELEKLEVIVDILSPTSTGVVEFGSEFINDYINVVETALGDNYGEFAWFVFENEFGRNKRSVTITQDDRNKDVQKTYKITNEQQFYDLIQKMK